MANITLRTIRIKKLYLGLKLYTNILYEIRIREQAKNKYHPHFFMEYIAAALIGYTNRMRMSVIGSLVKILWAPKSGIRLMMEPRRILDTGDKT